MILKFVILCYFGKKDFPLAISVFDLVLSKNHTDFLNFEFLFLFLFLFWEIYLKKGCLFSPKKIHSSSNDMCIY